MQIFKFNVVGTFCQLKYEIFFFVEDKLNIILFEIKRQIMILNI